MRAPGLSSHLSLRLAPLTGIHRMLTSTHRLVPGEASIRRLDKHGDAPTCADSMDAGLVCGQQARGRLRGEAR